MAIAIAAPVVSAAIGYIAGKGAVVTAYELAEKKRRFDEIIDLMVESLMAEAEGCPLKALSLSYSDEFLSGFRKRDALLITMVRRRLRRIEPEFEVDVDLDMEAMEAFAEKFIADATRVAEQVKRQQRKRQRQNE